MQQTITEEPLRQFITLNHCHGIGPMSFYALMDYFEHDATNVLRASHNELAQAGLNDRQIKSITNPPLGQSRRFT